MNLKDEVIHLLNKAKEEDEYQNPYFVAAILAALTDVYGDEHDDLSDWCQDLFSR